MSSTKQFGTDGMHLYVYPYTITMYTIAKIIKKYGTNKVKVGMTKKYSTRYKTITMRPTVIKAFGIRFCRSSKVLYVQ